MPACTTRGQGRCGILRVRTWERGVDTGAISAPVPAHASGWFQPIAIPAVDGRHVEIVDRDATCVLAALLNEQILTLKVEVLDICSIHHGRHASLLLLYLVQRYGAKQVAPLGCTYWVPVHRGFEPQCCVVAPQKYRKVAAKARFVGYTDVFLGKHRSPQTL